MAEYSTLNVKFSNSQLNTLKSGIKNGTEVTSNLSSNLVESSNDETNFSHKLLLTDTQFSKFAKVLQIVQQLIYNFSKTQLSKIIQSGGHIHDNLDLIFNPLKTAKKIINKVDKLSKK